MRPPLHIPLPATMIAPPRSRLIAIDSSAERQSFRFGSAGMRPAWIALACALALTFDDVLLLPRRSAIAHCMSSAAKFHPTKISYIYYRYKRVGDTAMDESYFPILWRQDGYRTDFLDEYVRKGSAADAKAAE